MLKHKITPLFISSDFGALFAMYYAPIASNASQCILHIPAFAEEMNKSRHMVAIQAQAWAEQGYSVLVLDLWGTGDSHGDFSAATWDIWLKNIDTAITWLQDKGYQSISLWGLRSGVLLAIEYIGKYNAHIDRLICWQPVLNGEQFIMQFLRLRIATAIIDKKKPQEQTSDLKKQLIDGQSVEVAGYCLNPELVVPMVSVEIEEINFDNVKQIHIFELTRGSEEQVRYTTTQWIKQIETKASLDVINGCSFWATQEISESVELIALSSKRVT